MNKILLRTVDTDVFLGISVAQKIGCDCLWFAFGTAWHHIPVSWRNGYGAGTGRSNFVITREGKTHCMGSMGCIEVYDDATSTLCTLSRMPTTESVMNVLPIIEWLIVIMYDRGRSESSVNGERLVPLLCNQKGREIEKKSRQHNIH